MSPGKSDELAAGLSGSTSSKTRPKALARVPGRGTRTGATITPSQASMGPAARKLVTELLGTASARRPATIVLMPMTRPRASASGPQELPGARRTSACTQGSEPKWRSGPTAWITPVVNAPTKPSGFPMAMASSPGRTCEESAAAAEGRFAAVMRSSARSRRVSRETRAASNSRPSQSWMRICEARATCALVMIAPSADQMTPEPLPRPPGLTRTVERRSFSAISPKPWIAMLFGSARAFADDDVDFLRCAAADELEREGFADGFAVQLRVNVFEARDRMARQCDENVSDDDAGFVRGTFRLDFENDGSGFFAALQGLAERVGQAHGLETYTEIALRDVAFFQERVDDAVDGGRGDGDGAEASEARRGDADGAALRVDYGAADGGGLQADVEADVRREGGAGPSAALGSDEADNAEGGYWAAGTGAADDQREAAGLQRGHVAKIGDGCGGFRTFQGSEIG